MIAPNNPTCCSASSIQRTAAAPSGLNATTNATCCFGTLNSLTQKSKLESRCLPTTGDMASAVKWSEVAVALEVADNQKREQYTKHLESFRQGKPWREE